MNIKYTDNVDNRTLFYYIVLFIGIVYVFATIDVNLGFVFGIGLGCIAVGALWKDYIDKKKEDRDVLDMQDTLLLPNSDRIAKYDDIVQYLFSIQDFYVDNPQAYEEMVQNIDNFFMYYEEIMNTDNEKQYAGRNYNLMVIQKRGALNALHSVIFNASTDTHYTAKLNESIVVLNTILDEYLDIINMHQKEYLYEHGYNTSITIIPHKNDRHILAKNQYDNDRIIDNSNDMGISYDVF